MQLLWEIRRRMEENQVLPEQVEDRIIFMSMYNVTDWRKVGNKDMCMSNTSSVAAYARRFLKGHRSFLGPGSAEKWYGTHSHKPNGSRNNVADRMMINLRESGHPPFRGTSALFRGALKGKGGGRTSIH